LGPFSSILFYICRCSEHSRCCLRHHRRLVSSDSQAPHLRLPRLLSVHTSRPPAICCCLHPLRVSACPQQSGLHRQVCPLLHPLEHHLDASSLASSFTRSASKCSSSMSTPRAVRWARTCTRQSSSTAASLSTSPLMILKKSAPRTTSLVCCRITSSARLIQGIRATAGREAPPRSCSSAKTEPLALRYSAERQ
jgi:hypothetical protein